MTTCTAPRITLGRSDLEVFPLNLGGNVFGWTADEQQSQRVLDAYVEGGGNFVDTADVYSAWADGHTGGESETVIGSWLRARGSRDDVLIASKVAMHPEFGGLGAENIARAADASLSRLGVDAIDLYYAHRDDENTPIAESAAAFSALVDAGKIRAIGASNYSGARLQEWLDVAAAAGLHAPVALQPRYNLMERGIEADVLPVARKAGLTVLPYSSLASGFLSGKYRDGRTVDSARAGGAGKYLDDRGRAVLAELDAIASAHDAQVPAVALAWLRQQEGSVVPIASARTLDQLPALLASVTLELTAVELDALSTASAPA